MLTGTLRIGTEFFLNRTETREGITHHFRLMRDTELTPVGTFIIWDDIEHTPGTWNFERYDWIYLRRRQSRDQHRRHPMLRKSSGMDTARRRCWLVSHQFLRQP
jgi:hypothetical protein